MNPWDKLEDDIARLESRSFVANAKIARLEARIEALEQAFYDKHEYLAPPATEDAKAARAAGNQQGKSHFGEVPLSLTDDQVFASCGECGHKQTDHGYHGCQLCRCDRDVRVFRTGDAVGKSDAHLPLTDDMRPDGWHTEPRDDGKVNIVYDPVAPCRVCNLPLHPMLGDPDTGIHDECICYEALPAADR